MCEFVRACMFAYVRVLREKSILVVWIQFFHNTIFSYSIQANPKTSSPLPGGVIDWELDNSREGLFRCETRGYLLTEYE